MKRFLSCLLVLALILSATTAISFAENLKSPANDLHTDAQYSYIMDENVDSIHNYADGSSNKLSRPKAIVCDFSKDNIGTASEYIFQKSATPDFAEAKTVTGLKTKSYDLYNVLLGEHFYWRGGTSLETIAESPVHEMTVNDKGPRVCYVDGMYNVRDIGGYESSLVPGSKIRQGLYYRTARPDPLDDNDDTGITELGKYQMYYELGVRAEIDIRDGNECKGPYIDGVEYNMFPIEMSTDASRFDGYATQFKQIYEVISHADEKPVYLHCKAGADRTGVSSFMLLMVCGASFEDAARDYLFTNFYGDGKRYLSVVKEWYDKLGQFDGYTKAEQAKNWMLSKGISEDTVERIREIFVPGYTAYMKLPGVSNVAAQLSSDGTQMRLIAAVNGLEYRNIGFTVTVNGEQKTYADNTVYSAITFNDSTLTSEDFGIDDGYLFTLIINDIPKELSVRASAFVTTVGAKGLTYPGGMTPFRVTDGEIFVAGGENLALKSTATDSGKEHYDSGKTPDKTIDGNTSTGWQYKDADYTDVWIQYDFDEPVTANVIKIVWESATRAADDGYEVVYSNDGETWKALPNAQYTHGYMSVIEFDTIEFSHLRLNITKPSNSKYAAQVYEFQLYRY